MEFVNRFAESGFRLFVLGRKRSNEIFPCVNHTFRCTIRSQSRIAACGTLPADCMNQLFGWTLGRFERLP
jgi:hypothetical protein